MASKTAKHVTLAEFYQNEERFIQEMREKLERMYIQRVEETLEKYSVRPSTAKRIAERVIRNGATYEPNADDDDNGTAQVNAIANEYEQMLNVALLFIQAPVKDENKGKTLKDDVKSRDLQYNNFIKRHPSLNQKVHKEERMVFDYDGMKKVILDFIKEYTPRAIIVPIFFNGHGTENGICFQKKKDGNAVPLETVIKDFEEALPSASKWPGRVELIFCQCFAHMYNQPDSLDFEVYHFTSEQFKRTYVTEIRDALSKDIVDAQHEELETDIPKSQKRWDEKLAEGKKMKTEVDKKPTISVEELSEGIDELEVFVDDGKENK